MKNIASYQYGHFLPEEPAGYEITRLDMKTPWEYIYQNRDVLLRVDQFGPVNAQAYPPGDIMLFKREKDERFSRWLVWLQSDSLNGGMPFTNFFRPVVSGNPNREPEDLKIRFLPHEAVYSYSFEGLRVETSFFVPNHGTDLYMECRVTNNSDHPLTLRMTPVMVPYVNPAQLAPWDKPEWYLKSGFGKEGEVVFWSQLLNAASIKENRRAVTLWTDAEDLKSFEISLERFFGAGDLSNPEAVYNERLCLNSSAGGRYGEWKEQNQIAGYPPVYAAQYEVKLEVGGEKTVRQVLSMPACAAPDYGLPSLERAKKPLYLFDAQALKKEKQERRAYFFRLFEKRRIHTQNSALDLYVNAWLPLQMDWVASLDRGWPTGMRGARDCANDFMGELYWNPGWAREVLLLLYECQRSDGWFPRQISTEGRKGKHDLREFVDAGAFAVEFLHEYVCETGDFGLLKERVKWLNREDEDSIWEHALRALSYYLDPENIGEHGLCKIRGGDWLDAVNRAGLEGRGESVMVTCQVVLAIQYVLELAEGAGMRLPREDWKEKQGALQQAVAEKAYNQKGFFSGLFTDKGEWVFSDQDPDGACRPYVCANAYAILAGAADGARKASVFRVLRTLKGGAGYRLYAPPIGKKPIERVGRSGSGDAAEGLFENGAVYNHGSHGFLGRALAACGEKEELLETISFLLPFDMEKHPTEEALTPPYAVVNCWQKVPLYYNRGGMLFLTGSIAMAVRMVYNWLFGIQPGARVLRVSPCCADSLCPAEVHFSVRGKSLTLKLAPGGNRLLLNGKPVLKKERDELSEQEFFLVPYEELPDGGILEWRS